MYCLETPRFQTGKRVTVASGLSMHCENNTRRLVAARVQLRVLSATERIEILLIL